MSPSGSAADAGTLADPRMTTGTERAGLAALEGSGSALWQRVRDYVTLTKPRIISLLLVTTLCPMLVAAGGWPGSLRVLATLAGGYLMAGGANAINMVLDRDIDRLMARTRLRPIPSGRVSAGEGLAFGLTLAASAFILLWTVVNPPSALLSLGGLVYYVLVYTRWLKRSSPQNIVVGGAAGAFPPLVGWAAVTGEVGATALALFLIVFLWTPPHFWALALVKQKDYGRVGVPMAPNVWGEAKTVRKMLLYTLLLLPVSLVPLREPGLGLVYGGSALLLGLWLLGGVLRVRRATDCTRPAWALYRHSLLYLALLFAALALDAALHGALPG